MLGSFRRINFPSVEIMRIWLLLQEPFGETKSLLSDPETLSESGGAIYGSLSEESVREAPQSRWKNDCRASFTLFLSSVIIVAALFSCGTLFHHVNESPKEGSFSQTLLSKLVFAPDIADASTSFRSLANSMMPAWYQETLSRMPIFTPTVLPGHVYETRKILLKTRDLLDAFSPVYPNTTKTVDGSNVDMWRLIRHYLDQGYMIVGEFQDLHNAHVLYSQEQMEEKRNEVLEWKREFDEFRDTHDAPEFLASPTTKSYHHKESRLFWQTAERRPSGEDSATCSLQLLGSIQLEQVVTYFNLASPYVSVLDEDAHEHYHNLRKELRSVADEFELFGEIMFPMVPESVSSMEVIMKARKLLGDMNDDWTAYSIYVENDEYYDEQAMLARRIDDEWTYFKKWTYESDFEGVIRYLLENMNSCTLSLNQFLKLRKRQPTPHIVMGNEAGDADSIVSAITLAYIESTRETIPSTPIVSIPKADLTTQRPEVGLLLELAGILNAKNDLLFVDDPLIENNSLYVALVDHNVLAEKFQEKNWTVVEIVDHHEDVGQYTDTCSGSARTIAFADDKALVASACTLVAERLKEVWKPPYPPSLGVLLLGVILLDSVDLSPEVGKVTERDRDAVEDLLENTDWQGLPKESQIALGMTLFSVLDTTTFFNMLQGAKYDSSFWNALSVRDALRLDYKEFSYEGGAFGVSTVLMPLSDFLRKEDVVEGILQYMAEIDVDFLGIMFAFVDEGHLYRQLALCGANGFPLKDVDAFLLKSGYYRDPLDLEKIKDAPSHHYDQGLSVQLFDQHNVKPSRKQIGPILVEYFEVASGGDTDIDSA